MAFGAEEVGPFEKMYAVEHVAVEDPIPILPSVLGGVEQIPSTGKGIVVGVERDRNMLVEHAGTGRHVHSIALDRRRDLFRGRSNGSDERPKSQVNAPRGGASLGSPAAAPVAIANSRQSMAATPAASLFIACSFGFTGCHLCGVGPASVLRPIGQASGLLQRHRHHRYRVGDVGGRRGRRRWWRFCLEADRVRLRSRL